MKIHPEHAVNANSWIALARGRWELKARSYAERHSRVARLTLHGLGLPFQKHIDRRGTAAQQE